MLKTQSKRPTTHLVAINTNRYGDYRISSLRCKLLPRTFPVGEEESIELDGWLGGVGLVLKCSINPIIAGLLADIPESRAIGVIADVLHLDEFFKEVLAARETWVIPWECPIVVLDVVRYDILEAANRGVFQLFQVLAQAAIEFHAAYEVLGFVSWSGIPGRVY